jgi:hypothetical protein
VIKGLGIDLPVVLGDPNAFPLCDVAQYDPRLSQPDEPGATYLYAHARIGMFLPLLQASQVDDGKSLIGLDVQVYTTGAREYSYRIVQVRRHERSLVDARDVKTAQLWLQTSEGPTPSYPKLQVVAVPTGSEAVSSAVARPTPHPVVCH